MASSKECPIWLREKQVQKVKAEKGCSLVEARKLIAQQTQPAGTAAVVVQSRPDTSVTQKKASYPEKSYLAAFFRHSSCCGRNWYPEKSLFDHSPTNYYLH